MNIWHQKIQMAMKPLAQRCPVPFGARLLEINTLSNCKLYYWISDWKGAKTYVLYVPAHPYTHLSLFFSFFFFMSVVRGSIESIIREGSDDEQQTSMLVSVSRLYRQKRRVFEGRGRSRWSGHIMVPRNCGIQVGQGPDFGVWKQAGLEEFLFTGAVRFGEAWLGCTPRYHDFLLMYQAAVESGSNPCHMDMNWEHRQDHMHNRFCGQKIKIYWSLVPAKIYFWGCINSTLCVVCRSKDPKSKAESMIKAFPLDSVLRHSSILRAAPFQIVCQMKGTVT